MIIVDKEGHALRRHPREMIATTLCHVTVIEYNFDPMVDPCIPLKRPLGCNGAGA
jgi:hypothetical protein